MNISAQVLSGADGFMLNSLTYMASPPPMHGGILNTVIPKKKKISY